MAREVVSHVLAPFSLATIPKVAATSQRYALLLWAGEDPTAFGQVHEHPALSRVVRRPIFAMVRHPLARLRACYRDRIVGPRPSRELRRELGNPNSFGAFVRALAEIGTGIDTHTRTQTAHLAGLDLELVVRLDDLPHSWDRIRAATGLGPLPHLNPSLRDRAREIAFDEDVTRIALDLYEEDLQLWSRTPKIR